MKLYFILLGLLFFLICFGLVIKNIKINTMISQFILNINTTIYTYKNFRIKYPITEASKPIYIFYHICPIGPLWKDIVHEQVNDLLNSGLYDKATTIFYGCSCSNCDVILKKYFKNLPKFKELNKAIVPKSNTHENLTINAMIDIAKTVDAYFLYIHSKGVTNKSFNLHIWRKFMMYWLVDRNDICLDILNRGFYTIGTFVNTHLKFYAGNFFWTRSDFIRNHKYITDLQNRYNAEHFLLTKRVKNKHVNLTNTALFSIILFKCGFYRKKTIDFKNNKYLNDDAIDICIF